MIFSLLLSLDAYNISQYDKRVKSHEINPGKAQSFTGNKE